MGLTADMMRGFPPAPGSQVTLANWRKPPFNRWSFGHVRELIPSIEIANDPENVRELASSPRSFVDFRVTHQGRVFDLAAFLDRTTTDALIILHGGQLAYEYYAAGMGPTTQHILMSVSKSVLGLVFGILSSRKRLDPGTLVTDIVPEVAHSAYAGATLRDLLDMRAGVLFAEDYLASSGPIIEYRKAQGWDPVETNDRPSDLRSFFAKLTERDGQHGGSLHYVSPNTDLLGWIIERAAGRRYADLVSECLWRPMGAERGAYITVDRLGAPRCAGGFCATARDLARLGLLVAERGRFRGAQIVPAAWLEDIVATDSTEAWNAGDLAEYLPGLPLHYRSKWYVLHGSAPMMFALGVFGQNLFVDRINNIVIAKFSSQALPMDKERIALTMRGIEAIRRYLSERAGS